MQTNRCEGVGGIEADAFEDFILQEMKDHVRETKSLSPPKVVQQNPKIFELKAKIEQITTEINLLLEKVASANDVLMDYINKRVKELDAQANVYRQQLSELSPLENSKKADITELRNYMDRGEDLSYDDKRNVVDQLIVVVKATEDSCEITWKF